MKNFMGDLINRIKTTKIFEAVSKLLGSLKGENKIFAKTKTATENFVNQTRGDSTSYSSVGDIIASKIMKTMKKFKKKFKNEDRAKSGIAKFINKVIKVLCTIATIAFLAVAVYMFIKILPTVILYVALAFAVLVALELIMGVINNSFVIS